MTSTADGMVTRVRVGYQLAAGNFSVTSPQTARSLANTNLYLGPGYTFTGTQYVQQRRTRIEIDLNVRVRGNDTFVGFEDVSGPIAVGESVEVYESESGVSGEGRITEIDGDRQLVYLSVDWPSLSEDGSPSSNEDASTATSSMRVLFTGTSGASSITSTSFAQGSSITSTSLAQGPWMELVPRPSLVDVSGIDKSIWITAPIYDSCGLLPGNVSGPYVEMRQNVLLRTSMVVAA